MGGAAGIPIDLVLFGMIAAFLALRLRSILGRRTGFEQQSVVAPPVPDQARRLRPVIDGKAEAAAVRSLPDATSPVGQDLARLRLMDPAFDAARFLAGAEQAFRLVVDAFATGNRTALRPLLTDEIYTAFDTAITARDAAGETQRTELKRITDVTIVSLVLPTAREPADNAISTDNMAGISVRFISDQISVCVDAQERVVSGVDAMMEIRDLWMFERTLGSKDPAWRLAAARSD